jgi:hypothetical protein
LFTATSVAGTTGSTGVYGIAVAIISTFTAELIRTKFVLLFTMLIRFTVGILRTTAAKN